MVDVATLGLSVDSKQAVKAKDDLKGLEDQAVKTEKATERLRDEFGRFAKSSDRANDATKFYTDSAGRLRDEFGRYAASGDRAAKATEKVSSESKRASSSLSGMTSALKAAKVAMVAMAAVSAAKVYVDLADAWSDMNSRVKLATGSIEAGKEAMQRLSDIARVTYSSLDVTVESFLRASTSLRELGYSTEQALDYTEALNNAMVVSGAKGQRAEMVANALGRAMASGALRGNELNTIIENGGRVSELLAQELGVTTNQLRRLGTEGLITGDIIYNSLVGNMSTLRDEADSMDATVADGFQLLSNSVLRSVGEFDQATGASGAFAQALVGLADVVNNFPETTFFELMVEFFNEGTKAVEATAKEIDLLAQGIGGLFSVLERPSVTWITDDMRLEAAAREAEDLWNQVSIAYDEILALNNVQMSEIYEEVVGLKEAMEAGTMSAEDAFHAIMVLGEVDPEFGKVSGKLAGLVDSLRGVRQAAAAAGQAVRDAFNASLGFDEGVGSDLDYNSYMKEMGFYKDMESPVNPPSRPLGWGSIDVEAERASRGSSGGGRGGGGVSRLDKLREELEGLRELYMTEQELLLESEMAKNQILNDARAANLISAQEHAALMEEVQREHATKMLELQLMPYADALGSIGGLMGDIASVVGENNDAMLAAQRVFGIASAIISMYVGAAKALELPFPANIGAMAAVLAQGVKLVAGIKSGSSSVSSGGGGAAARPQAPVNAPEPTKQAININLDGEDDFISKKTVAKIMNTINDLNKDGHMLIVTGG